MITIYYHAVDKSLANIEEKLKSLSLAYKMQQDPEVEQPMLEDGLEVAHGKEAIQSYLEKLEGELDQWHYCAC